jgi:DedD protein
LNIAMKQRLVGTVVIGCLAIIFIPILLDGEGVSAPEMTASIPDVPPMPTVPVIATQRPDISPDTLSTPQDTQDNSALESANSRADQANATTETPPAPELPRLNTAGLPATWSVRLASFGELANAEALVDRLRGSGYKGFSRPIETSRGPLTAVYVGPVMTENEATRLQPELAGAFELEGVVVQFGIDELEQ